MKTISLQIPDSVKLNKNEIEILLACSLYQKGILSLGQAARMLNLDKSAFMNKLADYDISVFNYDEDELRNDIENA